MQSSNPVSSVSGIWATWDVFILNYITEKTNVVVVPLLSCL